MKWYGQIAYSHQEETSPGIIEDKPIVRNYIGDLLSNRKSNQTNDSINDDISITNQLSVVCDAYLLNSFHDILYVTFGGAKWKVSSVEVQPPRLILSFGSLYTEEVDENAN